MRRNGEGNFSESININENWVCVGNLEEGNFFVRKILRRIFVVGFIDFNLDDVIFVEEQFDVLDFRVFMRYYYVFREGEFYVLLKENVLEFYILSFGNDYGNWCIIVEKKENCD